MNRFALIGASYKTAGVERLGQLALPKDQIAARLPGLAAEIGAQELAYIGTCNRVEFVLAGDEPLAVQSCRDKLGKLLSIEALPDTETRRIFRAWTDEGAVEHLFLVAAGLDSAQAGEREIYAQVRGAWTTARAAGTCGPQLDYIFGEALRAAQDVHQLAAKPSNADSLANFAVKRALVHLNGKAGKIALVGVSPMTRHCARSFTEKKLPLTIINRTLESAEEFAAEVKAKVLALDAFKNDPTGFDVIITAVGGNELILDHPILKKMAAGTLIIDLGVPPNVDPAAAETCGLHRVGMDEVIADAAEGRTAKLGELASARVVIDEHLERLRSEYAIREAAPLLLRLTTEYQKAAVESLKRLPRAKNGSNGLGGDDEALRQWAESFARRLAHVPMKGLRALAAEAGPAAVRAYLDGVQDALTAGDTERKDTAKEKRS